MEYPVSQNIFLKCTKIGSNHHERPEIECTICVRGIHMTRNENDADESRFTSSILSHLGVIWSFCKHLFGSWRQPPQWLRVSIVQCFDQTWSRGCIEYHFTAMDQSEGDRGSSGEAFWEVTSQVVALWRVSYFFGISCTFCVKSWRRLKMHQLLFSGF